MNRLRNTALVTVLAMWAPAAWGDSPPQASPGPWMLLDTGLWVAVLLLAGFWHGIRQSNRMAQQRRYGRALLYALGGAVLGGLAPGA